MDDGSDGPLLTLTESRHASTVVVTATGEIDVATGPQLRATLATHLAADGTKAVVVDLAGVTFMGSTAIAVLVDAHWEAGQRGKTLRLVVGETRAVLRPLEAAGVAGMFEAFAGVDGALHAGSAGQ